MRAVLLLLAVVLMPVASSTPVAYDPYTRTYEGIAFQGSRDYAWDWFEPGQWACTMSYEKYWITLTLFSGAPDDVLLLESDGEDAGTPLAVATLGVPATILVENEDSCEEFYVTGLRVAGEARYEVQIENFFACAPVLVCVS